MPLDPEFVGILRCPKTRKPLRLANAQELHDLNLRIVNKQAVDASGRMREQPLTEGLVVDGEALLYPVDDGIPILLIDEAISLNALAR